MSEKGGAAAAVSALIAKSKLAGMWRERIDQHNTGSMQFERVERVIVEHTSVDAKQSGEQSPNEPSSEGGDFSAARSTPGNLWTA